MKRSSLAQRRRREARRALGLCPYCTTPNLKAEGRAACGYHLEQASEAQRARELRNEAAGRCRCGRERADGARWCPSCSSRWTSQLDNWHQTRHGGPQ